jgi:hypothetical protein
VFSGITGATITLGSTLPTINNGTTLTITGPNPLSSAGMMISGNNSVRIMQVNSGANVTLQYLTLTQGSVVGDPGESGGLAQGGAIFNQGTLTIMNCTFSANHATGGTGSLVGGAGGGGAIHNDAGAVTISDSSFSTNQAIAGLVNGAGFGGAINGFGTMTITNTTFSSNSVTGGGSKGGALTNGGGTTSLTNVTLTGNQADIGGAIFNANTGIVNLKGTILAANSPDNCDDNGPAPTDEGYNLSDPTGCDFTMTTSQAVPLAEIGLAAALADNGGPTQTIALTSANSLAVDIIPAAMCPATDQRGVPRLDNGESFCDIGAYEFQDPFAGTPGAANCHGQSVAALAQKYGGLHAAATALGFSSVGDLQAAILTFCGG